MRRLVLALTGALLGAMLVVAPAADAGTESSWIVTLVDGSDPSAEAPGLARRYGGRAGHVYEHALNGFQFVGSAQAASNLSRNPQVRTVVADGTVEAVAESLPTGVSRIDGDDAHTAGKRGSGAVVAVIDTGIDLNHPDLAANILSSGRDCINNDSVADDDQGHGTHVAGTIAAVDNTDGVIGVAPLAKLVPVKVLDASGSGSWSDVICGIDYVAANAGTIDVANMSLGGSGSAGSCTDGGMREAICSAVGVGVAFVVAAGNDAKNASGFVPAAYPEAITVSAFSDTNGNSTKQACSGIGPWKTCDEVFASFSNYGSIVDVMAPGVNISSTIINGYGTKSGTSMAAPHVAGVAALVKAANPDATPDAVASHLTATGECPDTFVNDGGPTCTGQGTWSGDPDGIAEPLVNARRAATTALGSGPTPGDTTAPTVSITAPTEGSTVSGTVSITADASDTNGVSRVEFRVDGSLIDTDTSSPYSVSWSSTSVSDGSHTISATAVDAAGNSAVASITVTVKNSADPTPSSGITLSATAYKLKGVQHADLTWSRSSATNVDVYRAGVKIATTANDGAHTDNIGNKGGGSYTYKVCEAGTSTCSNEVTVTF